MDLTVSEKIKLIAKRKGIGLLELSEQLGFSQQNLHQRLLRNAWSQEDLKVVAQKLGCTVDISFIDNETGERY